MTEIKSTMDIIMEKLNKIGISEEEKRKIIKKEAEDVAKKLITRYIKKMSVQDIIKELESIKSEKRDEIKNALINECIKRIEPYSKHNKNIFKLLELLTEKDINPLREVVSSLEERLKKEREKHSQYLISRLKQREIYGFAVVPNIEADQEWKKKIKDAKEELYLNMNNLISKLE